MPNEDDVSNSAKVHGGLRKVVKSFLSGIRRGAGADKADDVPLDADDESALLECKGMLDLLFSFSAWAKIIMAVVAYKIAEEKLWRGQADNAIDFLVKLLLVKKSTAYRYVAAGGVIRVANTHYDLLRLPASLDAFIPFTELEGEDTVIECLDFAFNDCHGDKLTKKVAQRAVDVFMMKRQAEIIDDKAIAFLNEQKRVKKVEPRNAESRSDESRNTEPRNSDTSAKEETADIKNDEANPKSLEQCIGAIVQQLKVVGQDKTLKSKHIHPMMTEMISISKEYLSRNRKAQVLEKLEAASKDLHVLFADALQKANG